LVGSEQQWQSDEHLSLVKTPNDVEQKEAVHAHKLGDRKQPCHLETHLVHEHNVGPFLHCFGPLHVFEVLESVLDSSGFEHEIVLCMLIANWSFDSGKVLRKYALHFLSSRKTLPFALGFESHIFLKLLDGLLDPV
jgi:hypothetical protein